METLSLPSNALKARLLGTHDKRIDVQPGDERDVYTQILDMAPPFPPKYQPREILNVEVGPPKKTRGTILRWN